MKPFHHFSIITRSAQYDAGVDGRHGTKLERLTTCIDPRDESNLSCHSVPWSVDYDQHQGVFLLMFLCDKVDTRLTYTHICYAYGCIGHELIYSC